VGKASNPRSSGRLGGCGEHEKNQGTSTHPMGFWVEDGERWSRLSTVARWSGSDGGGSTCAREKRRRKWRRGASYTGEAGEGTRCSAARDASGAATGEGSDIGGSGDMTLARRAAEKQGLTGGPAHYHSALCDLFKYF
jgi:hypothetical protein